MKISVVTDNGHRFTIPVPNGLICNALGAKMISMLSQCDGESGLSYELARALLGSIKDAKRVLNGLPLLEVEDDGAHVRIEL